MYLTAAANNYSHLFAALHFTKEECLKAVYETFEDLGKFYVQKKKDEAKDSDKEFAAAQAAIFYEHLINKLGYKLNPKRPTSLLSFNGKEFLVGLEDGTPSRNEVISMGSSYNFTLDEDKLREKMIVYVTGDDADKVNKVHSICDELNKLFPHEPRRGFECMFMITEKGYEPRESITLETFHELTR